MAPFSKANALAVEPSDPPVTLAAFATDPETCRVLEMAMSMEGMEGAIVDRADLAQVIARYRALPPPSDLIVDISGSDDPLQELLELAVLCPPSIRVFALGKIDNIDFYKKLTSLGITGYLTKPVSPERLFDMLARETTDDFGTSVPRRQGKILSVVGLQGGVGATSLAINIGWGLSRLLHRQACLVDLDLTSGSMALDLDVDPAQDLLELLADPARMDGIAASPSASTVTDRLSVIARGAAPLEAGQKLSPTAVQDLVRHLPSHVSYSVLDLPVGPADWLLPVLELSHTRVLVMDRRLASMRDMTVLLRRLAGNLEGRTMIVLNHSRPPGPMDFTKEQIEEAMGHEIAVEIPYAKSGLLGTLSPVQPLIARRGRAAQTLRDLVTDLAGFAPKPPWYKGFRPLRRRRNVR